METLIEPLEMTDNPKFHEQKCELLKNLSDDMIDLPLVSIIRQINELSWCFTLQCCYGHFVFSGQSDPHNLDPLPINEKISNIEYRIAYLAFSVDNCRIGKKFLNDIAKFEKLDPIEKQNNSKI